MFASWDECIAHITETFESDDSSSIHARLRLEANPAMVWNGTSTADPNYMVVHIASSIAPADQVDLLHLAAASEDLPLGALRILNNTVHIHQALPLAGLEPERLDQAIRLAATEAHALGKEI